jgi:hypothetical protein
MSSGFPVTTFFERHVRPGVRRNVRGAFPASHQGLPPPADHNSLVQVEGPPFLVQIGAFADGMDLHPIPRFADLASIRREPLEQVRAGVEDRQNHLVDEDKGLILEVLELYMLTPEESPRYQG